MTLEVPVIVAHIPANSLRPPECPKHLLRMKLSLQMQGGTRKYLSPDSICWTIYNRKFKRDDYFYPGNPDAEDVRQRLLKASTRLLDLPSALCCICRCVDFEYYYSGLPAAESLIVSNVTPLGMVQDMGSDCSLCQLMIYSSK